MVKRMRQICKTFFHQEEAATAVEYALLLALIIVFSISAILGTGDVQRALWFDTANDIQIINN